MGLLQTKFFTHPAGYFDFLTMSSHIRNPIYMQLVDHTRVSVVASRVWMYTQVALIAAHGSYAGFHSSYLRMCPFDIKNKNT